MRQRRARSYWCTINMAAVTLALPAVTSAAGTPTTATVEINDKDTTSRRAKGTTRFVLGLDSGGRESRVEVDGPKATFKIAVRTAGAKRGEAPLIAIDLRRAWHRVAKGRRRVTRLAASRRVPLGKRVVLGKIQTGEQLTEVVLTLR